MSNRFQVLFLILGFILLPEFLNAKSNSLIFNARTDLRVGMNQYYLIVNDFNQDQLTDIGFLNSDSSLVVIVLGKGNGDFEVFKKYKTGNYPCSFDSRDFNNDGIPDLAVVNCLDNTISLLLGNGDGTFLSAQNYGTGRNPQSLTVADFDQDKKPDVATADFHSGTVSLLENIYVKRYQPQKTFCKFE